MKPKVRRPRSARSALLWTLLLQPVWAIPFAVFFGTLFGAHREHYIITYKMSLVFAYCIGIGLWVTRYLIVPRACAGEDRGLRTGLFMISASVVGSYIAAFIIHFTILPGFMGDVRSVAVSGMFTLLFAGLFGGINFAIRYYRQSMDRARAIEQIRAQLAEAELRALRAQIRPHFLFNTLNTIASLIATHPAAAEDMTTHLADVFRYALRASEREHARLGDELEFLRSYLAIERTRFGDRLRVEESIEPGLEGVAVPSLLLQPLVENAVQHGISPRPEGGCVRISARREGDRLALEVSDDGEGLDPERAPSGNGFGLHSVRERLRAAGLADALRIESERGHGTHIRLLLPMNPSVVPAPKGASS